MKFPHVTIGLVVLLLVGYAVGVLFPGPGEAVRAKLGF
jgi:hypothetical protein